MLRNQSVTNLRQGKKQVPGKFGNTSLVLISSDDQVINVVMLNSSEQAWFDFTGQQDGLECALSMNQHAYGQEQGPAHPHLRQFTSDGCQKGVEFFFRMFPLLLVEDIRSCSGVHDGGRDKDMKQVDCTRVSPGFQQGTHPPFCPGRAI